MTRAQLIAIAAAVSALGAGALLFVNSAGDFTFDTVASGLDRFEILDRSQCTPAACNNAQCTAVKNILQDAGSPCSVGFADCSTRVGPVLRAWAADAGTPFSSQVYQRVRLIGMRCPAVDGGFSYGIMVDDAGFPLFQVSVTTPLCARAPLDGGGQTCLRDDGTGPRYFGAGNVFPAAQAFGTFCDAVECTVAYGDDPNITL
jgi:hypothetical protein